MLVVEKEGKIRIFDVENERAKTVLASFCILQYVIFQVYENNFLRFAFYITKNS